MRVWGLRTVVAAAVVAFLCAAGCRRHESETRSAAASRAGAPAAAEPSEGPDDADDSTPQSPATQPEPTPKAHQPRVERLHTSDGIVIVTRTPKAAPADLGVPAFRDASERESAVWRLKPPKGREWVLAIAELTTAAPVQRVEHFYRKALGDPEIRRTSAKSGNLVVLSRVKGLGPEKEPSETSRESESIVVRLTQDAGAKLTTIVIRRAVRGAPVKLEPSGDLPGRPRPKPRPRPRATPV